MAGIVMRRAGGVALTAAAVAAFAGVALVAAVALGHTAGRLAAGDPHRAAKWATMTFFAGGPLIAGWALLRARAARPSRAWVAPGLITAALVAFQGLLARGSWFAGGDDWLHIVIAQDAVDHGLDLDYLTRVVFIHYAPGHRLGYWALQEVAPLDWGVALAAMLALFAGCLVLLHMICRRLFGDRRSNLVVLLLFGSSAILVTSFMWLADGLHKLPSTFLSLLAIHAYLRHRLDRSRMALVVSVAAVSLGLMFFVKVLLVPLYLLLIRFLFLEPRLRRAPRALWEERWTWLAYAPTVAIYLWNYALNYGQGKVHRPPLDLLGDYLWTAWFRQVTPAFAGVQVNVDAIGLYVTVAALIQALLLAVILVSVLRKRSAWRAWAFWGVAFVANAVLVALGRLTTLGIHKLGSELRYYTEMTWLLPLALALAFYPGAVAGEPAPQPRARSPWWPLPRRIAPVLAAAALCTYVIAAVDTGVDQSRHWMANESNPAKRYVATLRRDAARLDRGGRKPVVIDDRAAFFMMGNGSYPWNRLERVVPIVTPHLRVVVADPDPLVVTGTGALARARLQPTGGGSRGLAGTGTVALASGRRRGRFCVAGGDVRFSARPALLGESLYGAFAYDVYGSGGSPGVISGPGGPADPGLLPLTARHGVEVVNLGRELRARVPSGTRVCVREIVIGWLGV